MSSTETVVAIVAGVLVLAGLRALFWVRRVRQMTRAGLALRDDRGPRGD